MTQKEIEKNLANTKVYVAGKSKEILEKLFTLGYEWKEASNGATIEVVNPATQELIDTVPNVTLEDVDVAVNVAAEEQKKWECVPIHERAEKLYRFVELVERDRNYVRIKGFVQNCDNADIRREWNSLTEKEQRAVADELYYHFHSSNL